MQVIGFEEEIPKNLMGCVLTLGNFDGLHLGHRALVGRTVEMAKALKVPAVVLTFDPHPMKVLHPDRGFRELFPLGDLKEQLETMGVAALLVEKFDMSLASLSAEEFLQQLILGRLNPKAVVVGYDFRFGKDRRGDFQLLKNNLATPGVMVEQVPALKVADEIISSSLVRQALLSGDVAAAQQMLGRPFELRGSIIDGDKRGRRLGFPTANLNFENEIVPRVGVYISEFVCQGKTYPSLTNVGYRPTFESAEEKHRLSVESFLMDQNLDLYARPARVKFLQRVRDEMAFPDGRTLALQIEKDLATARDFFAKRNLKRKNV